jgi:glycosyltransferase involved in cell wall biosynthesis
MRIPVVMSLHNFRLICAKGVFYRNNQICETCINSSPYNAIKNACYQNSAIKSIPVAMMIKKYNKGLALINKINKFIVPTKFSKNQFTKIGFNKNKIVIKPNFIINDLSSHISKNKNGFVYASRLSLDKGLYDLIDVYNELNFNLTVCGNGPLKAEIKKIKSINFL